MKWKIFTLFVAALAVPLAALAVLSLLARRPDSVGGSNARLAPCPASPNCVSSQATDAAHHVEPFPLHETPELSLGMLGEIIESMPGGRVVRIDDAYLHAEFTSRLFRFVDDLEFRVDDNRQGIQVRSASRVGHSDLGVNRRRTEEIRARFNSWIHNRK